MLGNINDAVEFNGQAIRREQNPVLRIGAEVFLSSPKTLSAKDTILFRFRVSPIWFEAPWTNLGAGGSDHTSSYSRSFQRIQSCTLNFFGIIPENKGVEARVPVLQEIEPLFYILLEKLILSKSINPLATLDFVKHHLHQIILK